MDKRLSYFLSAIMEDPRITVVHISLYLALVHQWYKQGSHDPLQVFSWEVMPRCKISGTATYHRCIRELDAYGYLRYVPSFNHYRGSRIYLTTPEPMNTRKLPKVEGGFFIWNTAFENDP